MGLPPELELLARYLLASIMLGESITHVQNTHFSCTLHLNNYSEARDNPANTIQVNQKYIRHFSNQWLPSTVKCARLSWVYLATQGFTALLGSPTEYNCHEWDSSDLRLSENATSGNTVLASPAWLPEELQIKMDHAWSMRWFAQQLLATHSKDLSTGPTQEGSVSMLVPQARITYWGHL